MPPPTPELSLYGLLQELDPSNRPLLVSPGSLNMLLGTLVDLLEPEQLPSVILLKQPPHQNWLKIIEPIQLQSLSKIYLCDTEEIRPISASIPIIPIQLETNSNLQQEYFALVLSSQLSAVIVARLRTKHPERLEMVSSFEPSVIQDILATIKTAIAVNYNTTPSRLLTETIPLSSQSIANDKIMANLLRQYIQRTEEEKVTQLRDELEQFIRNFAEKLSITLTHMKTALSLLSSKQLKRDQRQHYLEMIHREWERQHALISSLMELAGLDLNPESESSDPVYLEEIIPGIVSTYQPLAQEQGIMLGYTIPAGFPPVSCPESKFKQIILHLLNNSLKFTPSGGRIQVTAARSKEAVILAVRDTGKGIPSREIPKIFNSFYRGKTADKDSIGAGLGLTIVQHLVRRCGGSIEVVSKEGKGTTFSILLPIFDS